MENKTLTTDEENCEILKGFFASVFISKTSPLGTLFTELEDRNREQKEAPTVHTPWENGQGPATP